MSVPDRRLNGRVAVVTGGIHGIGRGIARELAEAGASVFVTGRSAPTLVDTHGRTTTLRCDHRRDDEVAAGVRAHYAASQVAAKMMVAQRHGLIVHLSHWVAQKRIGNVAYGVAKAATDKMTLDMADELRPYGVAVVSLYPGLVRTEKVMAAAQWLDLSNSESPEFTGRAVVALAADPEVVRHSGQVRIVADLAREYGFTDVDNTTPRALTLADV